MSDTYANSLDSYADDESFAFTKPKRRSLGKTVRKTKREAQTEQAKPKETANKKPDLMSDDPDLITFIESEHEVNEKRLDFDMLQNSESDGNMYRKESRRLTEARRELEKQL